MTCVFNFQKRGKKPKHSNPIYLLSYLTKMMQKTKPFENEIRQKNNWSNNGWRCILVNNIIFEIHIWHFFPLESIFSEIE
jgi:hypothetical protein